MQKAFLPICILLLSACTPAPAGRWTAPKIPICDQRGPESAQDVAVVNFAFTHTPSLSPRDKARIRKEIRTAISPCGVIDDELQEMLERVRQVYQHRGYFKARIEDPQFKVIRKNGSPKVIDVTIAVEEGRQYRFKHMSFTSGTVFPEDVLREQFPINSGDIFNTEKIHVGLDRLRQLYGAEGYINFTLVPDTVVDDDNGLISLKIDLDEGREFRYGRLIISGEESQPDAKEELLKAWRAYQGTVYDPGALGDFLRDIHARSNVRPEDIFEISKEESSGLVNVRLNLVKPSQELLPYLRAARARSSRHK
jgi:outer membrane translocation and assembly module TamA